MKKFRDRSIDGKMAEIFLIICVALVCCRQIFESSSAITFDLVYNAIRNVFLRALSLKYIVHVIFITLDIEKLERYGL